MDVMQRRDPLKTRRFRGSDRLKLSAAGRLAVSPHLADRHCWLSRQSEVIQSSHGGANGETASVRRGCQSAADVGILPEGCGSRFRVTAGPKLAPWPPSHMPTGYGLLFQLWRLPVQCTPTSTVNTSLASRKAPTLAPLGKQKVSSKR